MPDAVDSRAIAIRQGKGKGTGDNAETFAEQGLFNPQSRIRNRALVL